VQPEVVAEQAGAGDAVAVGRAQRQQRAVLENTSSPPGRRRRAASGIHRYGSHQMLAPYSDSARSNAALASGACSASAWMSGNVRPYSRWSRQAVAS
jgi:hypothetical protein